MKAPLDRLLASSGPVAAPSCRDVVLRRRSLALDGICFDGMIKELESFPVDGSRPGPILDKSDAHAAHLMHHSDFRQTSGTVW
jgi:hypothetical protein